METGEEKEEKEEDTNRLSPLLMVGRRRPTNRHGFQGLGLTHGQAQPRHNLGRLDDDSRDTARLIAIHGESPSSG